MPLPISGYLVDLLLYSSSRLLHLTRRQTLRSYPGITIINHCGTHMPLPISGYLVDLLLYSSSRLLHLTRQTNAAFLLGNNNNKPLWYPHAPTYIRIFSGLVAVLLLHLTRWTNAAFLPGNDNNKPLWYTHAPTYFRIFSGLVAVLLL